MEVDMGLAEPPAVSVGGDESFLPPLEILAPLGSLCCGVVICEARLTGIASG